MSFIYQLAVLGAPTAAQISELETTVADAVSMFGLRLGQDISWEIVPAAFTPHQQRSAAVVFFGGVDADHPSLPNLLRGGVPVVPVVSDLDRVATEVPEILHPLNCLSYANGGAKRVATALLECAGLLPKHVGSLSVIDETRPGRQRCRCSRRSLPGISTFSWIPIASRRQKIFRPCCGIGFATLTCC